MTDPTIRAVIGARIRELRIDRNLTQQQLADITGLTRPNISNIEVGKYSVGIDLLNKIANALDVTIQLIENAK